MGIPFGDSGQCGYALAENNGLIWGGDWGNDTVVHSFVDSDHVQRINVSDQAKLFNLSWYPNDDYDPVVVTAES